jgi:predicted PurR-regulated permease PerM
MSSTPPAPGEAPSTTSLVRATLTVIGLVAAAALAVILIVKLDRILTWLLIAGFFAVVLGPAVDFMQHRLRIRRRGLSAFIVFVLGVGLFALMIYAFVRPIVNQANHFVDHFPQYVEDAKAGRGSVGKIVKKYKIDDYIDRNQDRLRKALNNAGKPALTVAKSVANGLAALVTILVLTFLMLMEGPRMLTSGLGMLSPPHADRVRRVASDCAKAITGYVAGNLLISLIAATVTFVSLKLLGVPFAEVLALWVGFADLIPLVGATLGAIPTIGVAFLHSTPAGITMIAVYVAYQQFENHVLQVSIMSKTVKLNPLTVLVSVLVGVELFGILGALLAIPAAGVIQVIAQDIYQFHRGRGLDPTFGADKIPITEVLAEERTERGDHERRNPDREAS